MPIRQSEKARYPKDWPAISKRIRFERAGGKCEWPDCGAPHGELIFRRKKNPEEWRYPDSADLDDTGSEYRGCKVVLTVAHLDHQPENCEDANLLALCQLHHLRLDAKHHQSNAARTRRVKKRNLDLFEME